MRNISMHQLWLNSYLAADNQAYLESLYEIYLDQPHALPAQWRDYFAQLGAQDAVVPEVSHAKIQHQLKQLATVTPKLARAPASHGPQLYLQLVDFINSYRRLGHLRANIDPLQFRSMQYLTELELAKYNFTASEMQQELPAQYLLGLAQKPLTLTQVQQELTKIYCGSIGFEYMHINRSEEVLWFQHKIEHEWSNFQVSRAAQINILKLLIAADGLEKYIGNKYIGQKRFSLEGADSLIPILDTMINQASGYGVKEIVVGMAHRGRLNVLINIIGKKSSAIFAGFEGKNDNPHYSGDVKYHLGYSSNVQTMHGPMHLSLAFNPSHLEIVAPVVQGSVRVRQRRRQDYARELVVPIHIHGDAAFAGQGVVMECLNMSQARWFGVGGSVHIIINNQVGFTISNPCDSRSTWYCSDLGKMIEAPILHVNGNDPEAAYFAAQLALDYRQRFKRDIIIDLVCYRRHGHNEADEPAATQPKMYSIIRKMPALCTLYAQHLAAAGVVSATEEKELADTYRNKLDAGAAVVELMQDQSSYQYAQKWQAYCASSWDEPVNTGLPADKLQNLAHKLEYIPEGFVIQPQVKKMLDARKQMTLGQIPLNWGYAEALAYASLLDQGYPIRLCGQDAERGTFAHRHAVLHDQVSDTIYIPLSNVAPNQAQINVVDSLLSEEAVLAFEYGYSATDPEYLNIWEAQFGDFANGAQVVVDQFLSSGEQKWGRCCGLVMFLPHGYEGMGPEHSSARIERYLQLCAQENMQVCQPTTPAQIFHLLRRQMLRKYRKPLIVFTPKSLLRHNLAVSTLRELSDSEFLLVLPEVDDIVSAQVKRVVICTGKVYYDLLEWRRKAHVDTIALLRIEQLYPFPEQRVRDMLLAYPKCTEVVWCQEEPENQGAWAMIRSLLTSVITTKQELIYVGRPGAASPAVGYHKVHQIEQEHLVKKALNL